MIKEFQEINDSISKSPLYSEDLAPVLVEKRTWKMWDLAALWVGMAVCIPTYILASYMIRNGISWQMSLMIIGLANLVITLPMVLNGYAGVKYGIPFPVIGRAAFGTKGIHLPSVVRGIVACGWFGVQTWIGGLAFYAIWNAITGNPAYPDLTVGKFFCFFLFWLVNMYFIWKGTESIKWLEVWSAPILILIGVVLIFWGMNKGDGFLNVLNGGIQMQNPTGEIIISSSGSGSKELLISLSPVKKNDGTIKATEYQLSVYNSQGVLEKESGWKKFTPTQFPMKSNETNLIDNEKFISGNQHLKVQFRSEKSKTEKDFYYSSIIDVRFKNNKSFGITMWEYILWFTAMVGFWATMSLSISDITRFAKTQKDQILGQFIGLPVTMLFYSFVGIFVTFAAMLIFPDVLVVEDAPWDPVTLLSKFDNPGVVVFAQIAMIIATLSTNIAANVIAPANAFSNLFPKKISFRVGGVIAGVIGIAICPWWLMNQISDILIFVSGLLGPVLGIMLCDYFIIRKGKLELIELYKTDGLYSFNKTGINNSAMIAIFSGIFLAIVGKWVKLLEPLFNLSWFTGFIVSFVLYYFLMRNKRIDN